MIFPLTVSGQFFSLGCLKTALLTLELSFLHMSFSFVLIQINFFQRFEVALITVVCSFVVNSFHVFVDEPLMRSMINTIFTFELFFLFVDSTIMKLQFIIASACIIT